MDQQVTYNPKTGTLTLLIDGKVKATRKATVKRSERQMLYALEYSMISTTRSTTVDGIYVYEVVPSGEVKPHQPELLAKHLAKFKWPPKVWWDQLEDFEGPA